MGKCSDSPLIVYSSLKGYPPSNRHTAIGCTRADGQTGCRKNHAFLDWHECSAAETRTHTQSCTPFPEGFQLLGAHKPSVHKQRLAPAALLGPTRLAQNTVLPSKKTSKPIVWLPGRVPIVSRPHGMDAFADQIQSNNPHSQCCISCLQSVHGISHLSFPSCLRHKPLSRSLTSRNHPRRP